MRKHVTVIAALNIGMGAVLIVAALIVVLAMLGSGLFTISTGNNSPFWVLLGVALLVGFVLLLFAVPQVVAGVGLLKTKNWARYMAMVLAVIHLFNFPIGTAIGIYTILVLAQDETEGLFEQPGNSPQPERAADPASDISTEHLGA